MNDGSVTHIPVHEVAALVEAGAALIDVREHQETTMGVAPGALCMPTQAFNLDLLPADRPLLFICRSGSRSDAVATALAGMGYTTYNVLGGMLSWEAADLPILAENGRPGTVL